MHDIDGVQAGAGHQVTEVIQRIGSPASRSSSGADGSWTANFDVVVHSDHQMRRITGE
jgi:hypothetical protein